MGEGIGETDQEHIAAQREGKLVAGEPGAAGGFIEQPGQHEACKAEQSGLERGEVEDRLVDQKQFRVEIIDHDHQREAR